jgi:hypothetical protein
MLNRYINQVGGIAHGISGLLDRGFDNALATFPIRGDVQVASNELVIAVQGPLGFNVLVHLGREVELLAEIRANLLWHIGKRWHVTQMLLTFEGIHISRDILYPQLLTARA